MTVLPPISTLADDAGKQFDMLFGEEYRRVRASPATRDDAELGDRMLIAAKTLKAKSALKALLYEKAYELGIRNPTGYAAAAEAVKLLAKAQPARKLECQKKLLGVHRLEYARAKGSAKGRAGERLLVQTLAVADAALAAGRCAEAVPLYRRALGLAQVLRSSLRKAIIEKMRLAAEMQKRQIQAAALKAKLKKDPSDIEARSGLIRYYVVECDNPAEAAKILNDDLDETLRTYVPLAARATGEVPSGACMELAEWYRRFSDGASDVGKLTILRRARQYYKRFLAGGKGDTTPRIKARLELAKINKELSSLGSVDTAGIPLSGAVLIMTFNEDTLFEKGGHTCVRDLSGRGTHGVVFGAKLAAGKAGKAMSFDGVNDYIALANPTSLQNCGSQTIAMWLSPGGTSYTRAVYVKAFGGEGAITISYGGRLCYYYGEGGRQTYYYSRQSFSTAKGIAERTSSSSRTPRGPRRPKKKPAKWSHVACVRNLRTGQLKWYINGTLSDEAQARYRTIKPTPMNTYIGKSTSSNYSYKTFQGKIDELVIFSRALTQAEVKALYELGRDGKSLR